MHSNGRHSSPYSDGKEAFVHASFMNPEAKEMKEQETQIPKLTGCAGTHIAQQWRAHTHTHTESSITTHLDFSTTSNEHMCAL